MAEVTTSPHALNGVNVDRILEQVFTKSIDGFVVIQQGSDEQMPSALSKSIVFSRKISNKKLPVRLVSTSRWVAHQLAIAAQANTPTDNDAALRRFIELGDDAPTRLSDEDIDFFMTWSGGNITASSMNELRMVFSREPNLSEDAFKQKYLVKESKPRQAIVSRQAVILSRDQSTTLTGEGALNQESTNMGAAIPWQLQARFQKLWLSFEKQIGVPETRPRGFVKIFFEEDYYLTIPKLMQLRQGLFAQSERSSGVIGLLDAMARVAGKHSENFDWRGIAKECTQLSAAIAAIAPNPHGVSTRRR
jgi:hypothetical protein